MQKKYSIPILIIAVCLAGYLILKPAKESTVIPIAQPIATETVTTSQESDVTPQNELTVALIKEVYQKESKYYVVLDYVTVNPRTYNNLNLSNLNPKLRTFELTVDTKIQLIRYTPNGNSENPIVTPAELYRILKNNGEDYYSLIFVNDTPDMPTHTLFNQAYAAPFSVKVEQGKLVELREIYQE